jgi:hypothetical protein
MIDESLFKSDYLGKDGFIWWLGQVASRDSWKDQSSHLNFKDSNVSKKTWPERCKVRIIGYHSFKESDLKDEDLPWAHVMMDPALGSGQGGEGMPNNLTGGEVCFGFFLDGDDAQQPVVVGLLHRHRMVENYPKDNDFAFRPFTGHPGSIPPTKREKLNPSLPTEAPSPITPTIEAANPGIAFTDGNFVINPIDAFNVNLGLGVTANPLNVKFGDTLWTTEEAFVQVAFDKKSLISYTPPSNCKDNMIGQITQALQDFIGFTNGIQKYAGTYIDPILNEIVDIKNKVKSVARSIGGIIRLIINSIRGSLIKCIIYLFKKFIGIVVPSPQQTIISQATKTLLDKIFCIVEKVIPLIITFIEDLLIDLVDSAISAPICAIEQWTSSILAKAMDSIEEAIEPIISGISWLTGGLSDVFNVLNQASSLANTIYSFIGCDSLKCTTPSTWVSNIGPSNAEADNWSKIVGNINFLKGESESLGSLEAAISETSFYGGGSNYQSCNELVNDPKDQKDLPILYPGVRLSKCIPPIVDVYGDGIGAKLIPIVNSNGSILSVEIISGGTGYTFKPTLTIVDKSGYGTGATAEAIIDSKGTITKVLITSSGRGYCRGNYGDDVSSSKDLLLSASKTKIYEGESVDIKIVSLNVPDNTEIRYQIIGINRTDIKQNLEGTLLLKNSGASITIDSVADDIIKYKELTFKLPDYEKEVSVFIEDKTAKIKIGTYQLVSDKYRINEGGDFTIILTTTNIEDNTVIPFDISGISTGLIPNQEEYSNFKVVNNRSKIKFQTNKGIIRNNEIFKLELKNSKTSIGVVINTIKTPGISTIPKVCIQELVVTKPGIGYTSGDTITDGVNTYYPVIAPENGVIVSVKPLSVPVCGFTDPPTITINTNTGIGAEIVPVVSLETSQSSGGNRELNQNNIGFGASVINVVDCV